METKLSIPTLSSLLGIELRTTDEGLMALRAFHEKYPDETEFDPSQPVVTFNSEDISFELRSDLSQDQDLVFKIVAITHYPTETKFDSGWVESVDEALELLIDAFEEEEEEEEDGDDEEEDGDDEEEDGDDEEEEEEGDDEEEEEEEDGDESIPAK